MTETIDEQYATTRLAEAQAILDALPPEKHGGANTTNLAIALILATARAEPGAPAEFIARKITLIIPAIAAVVFAIIASAEAESKH